MPHHGRTVRSVPADLRGLLRHATGRYHQRLDSTSVLAPLGQPGLALAQYQRALAALARTYRAIDASLAQPPAGPTALTCRIPPYLAHAPDMEADLRAMGLACADGSPHAMLLPTAPPDLPTYLGMRYVIAGAQFGNRVIGRNLAAVFGTLSSTICTAFLNAPTDNDEWRGIQAAINTLDSRDDVAAMVRGARQTFQYFVVCLSPAEPL